MKKIKKDYVYAVGRRRLAVARVRLFRGKGDNTINGLLSEKYFSGLNADLSTKPFRVVDCFGKYYVTVKVCGGGISGQAGAVSHGIARALAKVNKDEFGKLLKKSGLLTRDSRIRERRKVNTGGKARRVKQSPKR